MCDEFLGYLRSLIASGGSKKHLNIHSIQDEALSLFGKRKELDDAVREKYLLREAKKVFGGSLVKEWTGLSRWQDVKTVTDAMRDRVLDGVDTPDRDWREEMIKLSVRGRRALALKLKEEFGLPKPVEVATDAANTPTPS